MFEKMEGLEVLEVLKVLEELEGGGEVGVEECHLHHRLL